MFCFQCEQTAGGKCCTAQKGVCGKPAVTSNLQDTLVGALITLAQKQTPSEANTSLITEGLFLTLSNVNYDDEETTT